MPTREAARQGLEVVGSVFQVAGQPSQLVLGVGQTVASLCQLATFQRRDGLADRIDVEPRPSVLDERRVDVERQPARVFLNDALFLGKLVQGVGLATQIGGAAGLVALLLGDLVGALGEFFGLLGLGREDVGTQVRRLLQERVQLVPHGVLLGGELVQTQAIRRRRVGFVFLLGSGVIGDLGLLVGEPLKAADVGLALDKCVEIALNLFEPHRDRAETSIGLSQIGESLGGVFVLPRLVERRAGGLGLDVRSLPRGAGERVKGRVFFQASGKRLEILDQRPRGGLATGKLLHLVAVERAVAVAGGVGGVTQQFGRLAILGRGLFQGVQLGLHALAPGLTLARAQSGSALSTTVSRRSPDQTTFGPFGTGRLSVTRTRQVTTSPGFTRSGFKTKAASPRATTVPNPRILAS